MRFPALRECKSCGVKKELSAFRMAHGKWPRGDCKECEAEAARAGREEGKRGATRPKPQPVVEAPQEPRSEPEPIEDTSTDALAVARLRRENTGLKARLRELEHTALDSDAIRALVGSLDAPNVTSDPDWLRGAREPSGARGTAILMVSDLHFDEVVNARQIGGCNEFNREIADRRIKNLFRSTVMLLKRHLSGTYDGIVCNLGGDLLSGNIHEELAETNEAPITQSIVALEELLIEGLGILADEFGQVHVPCVTGNHGRLHKKPRYKDRAFHNFEWLIYQRLVAYFKGDGRLTFDVAEGPDSSYSVYDRRYCLTHGDQFSGGGGIGGIMVPIMRGMSRKQMRQNAIGDPFDLLLMGHWHQYIHTGALVINGSVKGYDEFAAGHNLPFEPPQQALFIEHPEHGVTFRMPVLVDKEA